MCRVWLAGSREDVNVSLRWQVTHRLVFDMKKVERVFPVPQLPPPPSCCWDVRAAIKFLSNSRRGMGHICRRCAPRPTVTVFSKHAKPLFSFCSSNSFLSFPFLCLLLYPPPSHFMTVYAKWRFLLSSPACGWLKQINKSMRTHIHSQVVCAHPTST